MRNYFIIAFLLSCFILLGQEGLDKIKKGGDTINYSFINLASNYTLKKVTQNKSKIIHTCPKDLKFRISRDSSSYLKSFKLSDGTSPKSTDTIIDISWYLKKDTECLKFHCNHSENLAKLKVNILSNAIILDRLMCPKESNPLILIFKVIKFSNVEIILQDLQKLPYKRYYYFRTKYTK